MSALIACMLSCAIGQVVLRGEGEPQRAPVEEVSLEGVRVGGTEARTIGLDGVKIVLGEHAGDWALVQGIATDAWRARTRLARGDYRLAAPIFEELWETYEGRDGPTALLVAEGALRCRLAGDGQVAAVDSWLKALELRQRGIKLAGDPPIEPIIDTTTGLVPALPPFWSRVQAAGSGAGWGVFVSETPEIAAMANLYERAMLGQTSGMVDVEPIQDESMRDSVRFVATLIDAVGDDSDARANARGRLESALESQIGTWREAWIRFALGRSYIMEPGRSGLTPGVLHLLHIPARFERSLPYLAGLALSEAGVALARAGEAAPAEALLDEMTAAFADHPALSALEEAIHAGPVRSASDGSNTE